MTAPSAYYPPGTRWAFRLIGNRGALWRPADRVGHLVTFSYRAVVEIPHALRYYQRETLRVLADITFGRGSLVVGGGVAGLMILLGIAVGGTVAVQAFATLDTIGLGPLTAVIAAYANTREFAPILAGVGFAVQAGCRMTAEIGAMRINEEIDALESIGLRSISYVVSTRLVAGLLCLIPMYLITLIVSYATCAYLITVVSEQSSGTYAHYFNQFIALDDLALSLLKVSIFVLAATLVHCYQGFFASGGPEGVGTASGRAVRASLIVIIILDMLLTFALWGLSPTLNFTG